MLHFEFIQDCMKYKYDNQNSMIKAQSAINKSFLDNVPFRH